MAFQVRRFNESLYNNIIQCILAVLTVFCSSLPMTIACWFATCRTTILPSEEDLDYILSEIETFHISFLKKYGKL